MRRNPQRCCGDLVVGNEAHPEAEIPQPPRFAVQRLVDDEWRTITFNDGAFDDPYDGRPLLYQSRYVAECIAKSYSDDVTVRVHEIGGAT
jgi:hypothetical protein